MDDDQVFHDLVLHAGLLLGLDSEEIASDYIDSRRKVGPLGPLCGGRQLKLLDLLRQLDLIWPWVVQRILHLAPAGVRPRHALLGRALLRMGRVVGSLQVTRQNDVIEKIDQPAAQLQAVLHLHDIVGIEVGENEAQALV